MTVPVTAARQATFCTDPADTVSENGIRRGNIELPVIDDPNTESEVRHISISQASSPAPSSPIYGSRSALRRFKEECRVTQVKLPPALDDTSDLDILSDVGLIGDSDGEIAPVVTPLPLSLSARSKLRKAPRIKVPSCKVDNTEPTIEEETTQDVLAVRSPVADTSSNEIIHEQQSQIRSDTVIVSKRLEFGEQSEEQIIKKTSSPESVEPNDNNDVDEESSQLTNGKHKVHSIGKDRLNTPRLDYEHESSFYESDWQPKKSDKSFELTSSTLENKCSDFVHEDKSVISQKYNTEIKPSLTSSFEQNKFHTFSEPHKKRPRSSGDESRPRKEKRSVPRRISEHKTPIKEISFEHRDHSETDFAKQLRPKSVEVPPLQTPLISEFCGGVDKFHSPRDKTRADKNERVSGIPKRGAHYRDSPRSNSQSKIWHAKPAKVAYKSNKMADGDEYAHETFEEVLQERNSLVKAERTYQKRIKQLEDELKGMINQCQSLSDENKELRKTIDSLKIKNEETTKSVEKDDDSVALATRIARLETEKENLVKVNEKLSLALKENDNKKRQSDNVFVENTKLKNKNSELEKRVGALEREVESTSIKLKELNSERTGKASAMDFKYRELQVALADVKSENLSLSDKVTSLERDNKLLTNTLDEKRIELNEVMRAMKNETVTETELKTSKEKLENAQVEVDSVKRELNEMRKTLQQSETNREKLRSIISQRDSDLKRSKHDHDHKDRVMVDLRHSLEKAKDEVQRHQEAKSNSRELEKETMALKSRIGSLKAEIESSLQENQRLKRDREDVSHELNRLRNENVAASDAIIESKRYFRKWEQERDARNKAEVELAKKQEEIEALDSRVKDGGTKVNVLYGRLRALEDDRNRYKGPNGQELETNNKILQDENKKLRQMLVERNIELANKQNEKEVMTSRMDVLERKQKDADVRVTQLSGWVSSIDGDSQTSARDGANRDSTKEHLPPRHPRAPPSKSSYRHPIPSSSTNTSQNRARPVEPQIAFVSPRSRKKGVKRNAHHTMTPPPGWDKLKNKNNDIDDSNHTPLSLPIIDSKSYTPPDPGGGYFQMYQEKLRRMKERRF